MMQTLELGNGSSLVFRDTGRGGPLLLIHGWGMSGALFEPQSKALASRFRVLAPDLPGHGQSGPFSDDATFSELADSIAGLITHLELEEVCLVGWSLGAMVAWDLLERYPDVPVSKLVCIDMVPRLLSTEQWTHGLLEPRENGVFQTHAGRIRENWPSYVDKMVPRIFQPQASPQRTALIDWASRIAGKGDPVSLGNIWLAMGTVDARSHLSDISIPALVVTGRHSQLYGTEAGAWVAQQIPDARLKVFEQSGHAPHLEEPELFNRTLADFAADSEQPPLQPSTQSPVQTGLEN